MILARMPISQIKRAVPDVSSLKWNYTIFKEVNIMSTKTKSRTPIYDVVSKVSGKEGCK